MNRPPRQRTSAIQNEAAPAGHGETKVTAEAPQASKAPVALSWRLAILVWLCGFLGLFFYEVGSLLWKIAGRMF